MIRQFLVCSGLALVTAAIPLRAANRPHAGAAGEAIKVWTNDDLEKLHTLGLISIVGQTGEGTSISESAPQSVEVTQDPEWYAQRAARLRDELERKRTQFREYQQAIDDARSLRASTGGIDLAAPEFAITPDAGMEILQQRVTEREARLDDLEDLARRNDIEPGALRGE